MEVISNVKKEENVNKKNRGVSIQFKMDEVKMTIQSLFNIESFIPFTKNFSYKEIMKNSYNNLKEMKNSICLLINTKKILINDCEWIINDKNKFPVFKDKLTVSFIEHFIKSFKSVSNKNTEIFHLYSFNKGNDLEAFDLNDIKKNLIQRSFTPKSNNCDVLRAMSTLFNMEQDEILNEVNENKYQKFLRIVVMTGSPSTPIDNESFKSILSSFDNNSVYTSLVINFLLLENDYYFDLITKNFQDVKNYTDFKEEKNSLNKSTDKITFLLNVYNTQENECNKLSQDIFNYGRKVLSAFDKQKINTSEPFKVLLNEFMTESEKVIKLYIDIQETVVNSLKSYKRKETGKNDKDNIKAKIENMKKENVLQKTIKTIKEFSNKYYETKQLKFLIDTETNTLKEFYRSIEKLDHQINSNGKLNFNI